MAYLKREGDRENEDRKPEAWSQSMHMKIKIDMNVHSVMHRVYSVTQFGPVCSQSKHLLYRIKE